MAKRDWLSRVHRLQIAEMAIQWLALLPEDKREARYFGCACTVIERYLIDGGPVTAEIHSEFPATVIPLRVV